MEKKQVVRGDRYPAPEISRLSAWINAGSFDLDTHSCARIGLIGNLLFFKEGRMQFSFMPRMKDGITQ